MFLNPKGRQVLVNSVVDSAISYLMAAMLLPAGILRPEKKSLYFVREEPHQWGYMPSCMELGVHAERKRGARSEGRCRSKPMLGAETSP